MSDLNRSESDPFNENDYKDDYDKSDEEDKDESSTIEIGEESSVCSGSKPRPAVVASLGTLLYWCADCNKKYELWVNDKLTCFDMSHKIYRLGDWYRSQVKTHHLCEFPCDAKDGDIVIFCDGSLRDAIICCGIIIRDHTLNFEESLRTVKEEVGMTSTCAELKALNLAVKKAFHLLSGRPPTSQNNLTCWIYSDCLPVVDFFNKKGSSKDKGLLREIISNCEVTIGTAKANGWDIKIGWVWRESNMIVDRLTKRKKLGNYRRNKPRPLKMILRLLYEEKVIKINRFRFPDDKKVGRAKGKEHEHVTEGKIEVKSTEELLKIGGSAKGKEHEHVTEEKNEEKIEVKATEEVMNIGHLKHPYKNDGTAKGKKGSCHGMES